MERESIGHGATPESVGSNIPLPVEIFEPLSRLFIGIVKIDLENGSVLILQDSLDSKNLYQTFPWDEYLALKASVSPRQRVEELLCTRFSACELLNAFSEGRPLGEFNFRYDDYAREIVEYAEDWVVPADRKRSSGI